MGKKTDIDTDTGLVWEVFELPESSRVYWVKGTRIEKCYGVLPNPDEGIYKTYNAAKRAVARYRKEAEDYWYSHPGSSFKNIKKQIGIAFDEAWEKFQEECENFDLSHSKTVKIAKITMDGLPEYKRAGDNKDEDKND